MSRETQEWGGLGGPYVLPLWLPDSSPTQQEVFSDGCQLQPRGWKGSTGEASIQQKAAPGTQPALILSLSPADSIGIIHIMPTLPHPVRFPIGKASSALLGGEELSEIWEPYWPVSKQGRGPTSVLPRLLSPLLLFVPPVKWVTDALFCWTEGRDWGLSISGVPL